MKKAMKQSRMLFLLNVATVFVTVLLMATCVANYFLSGSMQEGYDNKTMLTLNANRFLNASTLLTNEVRAYAATGNSVHYDNYWDEINKDKNREIALENMNNIGLTDIELGVIEKMSTLSNNLVPLESNAMDNVKLGDLKSAVDYVYGDAYCDVVLDINTLKTEFLTMLDTRTTDVVDVLVKRIFTLQIIQWIFALMIILMQLVNHSIIHKKLMKPIKIIENQLGEIARGQIDTPFALTPDTSEIGSLIGSIISIKAELNRYVADISEKLNKIANRDLDLVIDIDYIGNFSPIKSSLEKIIAELSAAMENIQETATQVTIGSESISVGSQTLAQGALDQAGSVQALSLSISTMSEQTNETAESAQIANKKVTYVMHEMEANNTQMSAVIIAMEEINQSSHEIGKIIKTIEDIAFQTNILALNAAVEAARAGEAGRGFAVVADEVRNLAHKSAEASKNTAELIENSLRAVTSGSEMANKAAQDISKVLIGANDVVEIIGKISTSSTAQAEALIATAYDIEQIEGVVQANAATAEQSAAASEELSAQAQVMRELVGRFNLMKSGNNYPEHQQFDDTKYAEFM